MTLRHVRTLHPGAGVVPLGRFSLFDIESVRLVLRGSSVVDWIRLRFASDAEIDAFLRVNEFEPTDAEDNARLLDLKLKATRYLEEHLNYRLPDPVVSAHDVRQLFRLASQPEGRRSHRLYACMTLKVMHIIHHAEASELLNQLPLSQAELAMMLQAKIERTVRGLIERRFPIQLFTGNRKTRYSVLSKLLAKKDSQSAQIYDILRFRLVVARREDIPTVVLALTRELMPFNYVVPLQTHNSLLDFDEMLVRAGNPDAVKTDEALNEEPLTGLVGERRNEFSGPNYRVVNLVADLPVRVDPFVRMAPRQFQGLGGTVFGTVEIQIVDEKTEQQNATGESRHDRYKARQRARVRERIEGGQSRKRARETSS